MIDGCMADIRTGYHWALTKLPEIMRTYGVVVDHQRTVIIGWSTGGHLAMSLAWTTISAGLQPPTAILVFYAPVDFRGGGMQNFQFSKSSLT